MSPPPPDRLRFPLALGLLTVLAAALRVFRLAELPPTSDDLGVAASAYEFVEHGQFGLTMWQHPKLRSVLTYGSLHLLGDGPWGLKGPSLLLGTMSVPLAGLLARRLFGSVTIALLAALFLAVDPIHVDFSRQAIQEVHVGFFVLAGTLAALAYDARAWRGGFALAAGVLFGLGAAEKWSAAFPLVAVMGYLLWRTLADARLAPREKLGESAFLVVALGVVPVTVYLLTFAPWFFHRGFDLGDWIAAQRFMAEENLTHTGFNAYLMENDSYAALWFVKPVAFADFVLRGTKPIVFVAISNPLVWMATLPAYVALGWRAFARRDPAALLLSAIFWCSYLPLALLLRPIWVNSSLGVAPLAFIGVAWGVHALAGRIASTRALRLYVAAVCVTAAPLYVLAIGGGYHAPVLGAIVERFRPAHER